MTDTSGSPPPFPGFPGFPPAEMFDRMLGMMRLSPFGSAFGGAQPGAGLAPSLSMMSDMMAPLTNVEELDKRITDMRAVEQWLKLNLSMLQSAIQALEVQRATLATLRAFGAFAQQSMTQPSTAGQAPSPAPAPAPSPSPASRWPHSEASASAAGSGSTSAESAGAAEPESGEEAASAAPSFDATAWWNLLQSQFNQIAQFAMTQPMAGAADAATGGAQADAAGDSADDAADLASEAVGGATDVPRPSPADAAAAAAASREPAESAAKRPAAKRAPAAAKRTAAGTGSNASKPPKKSL
ncbi:PhaM family polyhydroxyalkanoate granule multifunctional regulatory protein [Burkholderia sp. WSM2232]|uniref:PhaM family polyhydroxyalkanoate granule multifunctional regulatory protein n=1 Tax=Burkholderia sp. WSM2232 TaxID=944436 RepID=UPI0004194CF6|nr:PhaM family polyhydroxyalkanoate granule multifunctional regulatory protein [Burkholderia sp. WSM2232]